MALPLKTFICYAHEDRATVDALLKHLHQLKKNGTLEIWDDGQILAGQHWDKSIKLRLESAQLILLFISVDFIFSEYIEKTELKEALQRHRDGHATLIPIIVRTCGWEDYFALGKFQALPNKARPILSEHFRFLDDACHEVAQGIKSVAQDLHKRLAAIEEAAEQAKNAEQAAREAQEQLEKAERSRNLRDEAAWKHLHKQATAATDPAERIASYETYLDGDGNRNHRDEAQSHIDDIRAVMEADRKLAEKKEAARRQKEADDNRKAEEARRQKEADGNRKAEEARRLADDKRKADEAYTLTHMVEVKGGTYIRGSNEFDNEKPPRTIAISSFMMGKYPVTQKLWRDIMGNNHDTHFKGDDLPVDSVNCDDVDAFLKKINDRFPGKNFRLPTEAEWEYAARGGHKADPVHPFKYAGSNDLDKVGWYWENSGDKPLSGDWDYEKKLKPNNCRPHPVGKKAPNQLGIHDMSGNVWEWCADWYDGEYYKKSPDKDPLNSNKGSNRVLRGGSWNGSAVYCRAANRRRGAPGYRNVNYGFRLACSAPQ